jgi:hypothetical protein
MQDFCKDAQPCVYAYIKETPHRGVSTTETGKKQSYFIRLSIGTNSLRRGPM